MRVSYGGSAMRLAKYLAHAGVASRRAAEQLIFDGRVTVDGEVVTDPAARRRRLAARSRSTATGRRHRPASASSTSLNKPPGVVSTAQRHRTAARPSSTSSDADAPPLPGRPARRRHAPA